MNETIQIDVDVNRLKDIGTVVNGGFRSLTDDDQSKVLDWVCGQVRNHNEAEVVVWLRPMPTELACRITASLMGRVDKLVYGAPNQIGSVIFERGA